MYSWWQRTVCISGHLIPGLHYLETWENGTRERRIISVSSNLVFTGTTWRGNVFLLGKHQYSKHAVSIPGISERCWRRLTICSPGSQIRVSSPFIPPNGHLSNFLYRLLWSRQFKRWLETSGTRLAR